MTLSYCNHLGLVMDLWQRQKFIYFCFVLLCFVFEGDFQVQDARGAYIRRDDFTEDFLRYKYGGLYLEGLNFGILRYFPEILRCRLTYYESKNFSGSSLHHIFESENFRFRIL